MRVIIRFSLENDRHPRDPKKSGYLTSKLGYFLKSNQLIKHRGRTATYEGSGDNLTIDLLRKALNKFFEKVEGQKTATIDHFWMYVDSGPMLKRGDVQSQPKTTRKKAGQGKGVLSE
jgi:hypothetical protein